MHARLECKHLTVAVAGRSLIVDLNLDIAPGSFVCVLGTNGVGKTLTLHTLAGLRAPAAGEISLCDSNLTELSRKQISQRLGLLLQNQIDAVNGWEIERQLEIAADALRLPAWDAEVAKLSGGEKRRIALCRLLLSLPSPRARLVELDPSSRTLVCRRK